MRTRAMTTLVALLLVGLLPVAASAQLVPYSQDFESLVISDPTALETDGWLVFGNVFAPDGTTYLYGYGPFPAPNNGAAFCAINELQGGVDQGVQQLAVFSDYENVDHAVGNIIESNVYQEWTVAAEDVGETWVFAYEAKLGNLVGASTAAAFIKTLDPGAGFALTNFISQDMTNTPITWMGYTLSIEIDASLEGQILQIGFLNTATDYEGSAVFYDNIGFAEQATATPPASTVVGASLRQNYPNPFNPSTRIEFVLDRAQSVEISVFDMAGRRVATLERADLDAGEHSVTWNGRTDSGASVASGRYSYVLQTETARVTRQMVLLK